ncbi:hypothetical protein TNCV_3931151 [Trichonephila clavipes]|nr:hypothetical protein TNCV_3931151 [Trichonephila clavipes]
MYQLLTTSFIRLKNLSKVDNSKTNTDENVTKVKCPPLNLLQPLPKPDTSISTPVISTSSSTQAHLFPTTSSTAATVSDPQPPTPTPNNALSTTNNMFTPLKPSSTMSASLSNSSNQNPSDSTITQNLKKKIRDKKREKELLKTVIDIKMAQHKPRKSSNVEYRTDEEDMIVYDMENEIESNPGDKFVMKECYKNSPDTYLRAVTPTRFRRKVGANFH